MLPLQTSDTRSCKRSFCSLESSSWDKQCFNILSVLWRCLQVYFWVHSIFSKTSSSAFFSRTAQHFQWTMFQGGHRSICGGLLSSHKCTDAGSMMTVKQSIHLVQKLQCTSWGSFTSPSSVCPLSFCQDSRHTFWLQFTNRTMPKRMVLIVFCSRLLRNWRILR